jgi:hypothetical protein
MTGGYQQRVSASGDQRAAAQCRRSGCCGVPRRTQLVNEQSRMALLVFYWYLDLITHTIRVDLYIFNKIFLFNEIIKAVSLR